MSSTVPEPETPLHVGPDANMDLDNLIELDEKEIDDLNLDPGIDETPSFTDIPNQAACLAAANTSNHKRTLISEEDDDFTTERQHEDFDSAHDYQPRINFKSPFSGANDSNNSVKKEIQTIDVPINDVKKHRKLSMSQQSKFITYVDARLMEIQRKFVQSRGLNSEKGYLSLTTLLHDIKSLLDFIWYSIDNMPHTDYLLQLEKFDDFENLLEGDNTKLSNEKIPNQSHNFGQASFIIKIADDLMDYIEKFEITDDPLDDDDPDAATIPKIFKLFRILDRIFRSLIAGQNENKVILNSTDRIRFMAIAERTRMRLPQYFEKNNIHGYHFELSKIYEQSLDYCAY
ncbi:similar to Saccharomyces cerevisiae YOR352W Putative protein of unknown function [Maudiozyma saulgeensis]|uniref:Uncharacterized protein n=1 Tax=Maudiozyma saulgeensis TaxID=1789683 RepID=A0A1X7R557_9SACH|nr:similar to Saccharomyces cerevisiae YOR352W Putative protein of unknown function [Kazachstania saulgeensis]